jgi:membrane-bound lytic murein transglycosylase
MQLHIHVYGEGSATKENARNERAISEINQAIKLHCKQRKVRAQRRFIAALAASVSGGYLPLTSAYEILQKAHHDAK